MNKGAIYGLANTWKEESGNENQSLTGPILFEMLLGF